MEPRNRGQCIHCKEYHLEEDLRVISAEYRLCPTCYAEYMETQL